MRIGVDVRCLMQQEYSGVSWYTFNLLENLFKLDQKNEYQLFYNSSKKVFLPKFDQANIGYRGFRFPNKLFNLAVNFGNWPKIDKLIGGTEVFFVPNLHFIALSQKTSRLITVHDLSFLRCPEFFTLRSRLRHWLIVLKKIINQADLIFADSDNTKQDLVELLKIKEEKIKVIYLGTKLTPASIEDKERVRTKYHLPQKFILYLGTLEPRKNVPGIIRAYQLLAAEEELVIAGAAGWKTGEIYRLAKGNDKIKFFDYVAEEDKAALYSLARAFVYPSYYEGFGLPLLEAMACGCPVIGGGNSSQGEVVADAGLLVDAYNVREISLALESLLGDEGLRRLLIDRGLTRAKEFTWEKTAQEVLNIFNK
ncbi:MAG: glycosyltransferase family 1 protein [Patescibacteria group bacterium]